MPDAPVGSDNKSKNPEIEETRTSIDTLLEILRTRGKLELSSAAVALNIDPRILENWAKVLENGNLIRITFEVGKMYLEPVNLAPEEQKDLKAKTDISKFILEEDLAVEKISLDKFAKNLDTLSTTISNIDKMYQQKFPNVQKLLLEIDKLYLPLETKEKGIEKIKSDADLNLQEVGKKVDALIAKTNSLSPKQSEQDLNEKAARVGSVVESINKAQLIMSEMEKNERDFFDNMDKELDGKTKEFRKRIEPARRESEKSLRSRSKELDTLIKSIKGESTELQDLTKEIEGFGKEIESTKRYLTFIKTDFGDRYEKIKQDIEKDAKLIKEHSNKIGEEISAIKQSIGESAQIADDIKKWKKAVDDINKDINTSRNDISKLTNQLKGLDADKRMSVETRAKALDGINEEGKQTKSTTSKIKGTIKKLADEISDRAEKK